MKALVCNGRIIARDDDFTQEDSGMWRSANVRYADTVGAVCSVIDRDSEEAAQIDLANAPPPPTLDDYKNALQLMYNAKAAERRYDNYATCAMRAGYPGPWQAEGQSFGTWMDSCNAFGYGVLNQVMQAQIAQPSVAEFVAMVDTNVPALIWPEQVV